MTIMKPILSALLVTAWCAVAAPSSPLAQPMDGPFAGVEAAGAADPDPDRPVESAADYLARQRADSLARTLTAQAATIEANAKAEKRQRLRVARLLGIGLAANLGVAAVLVLRPDLIARLRRFLRRRRAGQTAARNDPQRPDQPRRGDRIANAVLLAGVIAVCVAGFEGAMGLVDGERLILTARTLYVPAQKYPAVASDYLPFTTPKSRTFEHDNPEFHVSYHFDAGGFRTSANPTPVVEPRRGAALFLGDSFTFGWGVAQDESFAGLIGGFLAAREGLESRNGGYRAGYAPDGYLAFLNREGAALAPRVIVVMIYSGNDISDLERSVWLETTPDGSPLRIDVPDLIRDHQGRLVVFGERTPARFLREPFSQSYALMGLLNLVNRAEMTPLHAELAARTAMAAQRPAGNGDGNGFQRLEMSLKGITSFCRAQGSRCVFGVIAPPPNLRTDDRMTLHRRIVAVMHRLGLAPVDLAERVPPHGYFPGDGHYNATGHVYAADSLLKSLGY